MKLIPMTAVLAVCGVFVPVAALAQAAPATGNAPRTTTSNAEELEEVVVSTRIVRDGYKAPTPTSVLGLEEIQASAPKNIADLVNQLPSFAGSNTPSLTTGSVGAGLAGINSLNLRALSNNSLNRTLVLLDGRRVPASAATGLVDINTIPQELITRVDVVTGGASAAWGSDALAGVVNFTLDRKFTGLKANLQGTGTTHGDNQGYNLSLTGGTGFASDRGHVILSGEIAHSDGIEGLPRDWYKGLKTLVNPAYTATNGQPFLLVRANSGYRTGTPGLIFTSGPLRDTYFGAGGTPAQLNLGSLAGTNGFVGGDWAYADFGRTGDLEAEVSRQSVFALVNYDLTENLELFAEASYGTSDIFSRAIDEFKLNGLRIQPDNAFLPANLAAILAAAGPVTANNAGSLNADLPPLIADNTRSLQRFAVGVNGSFDAAGSDWSWNAYLQSSRTNITNRALTSITANYNRAIDAVRNASGSIVCRVNADAVTTNDDPACVPYNILGTGTASQAAINYASGTSWLRTELVQDVAALTFRGEPLSTWAGPISLATGVEHRREKVGGTSDALSPTNAFFAGNFRPTIGSYNVTEGFIETVVPLAADKAFAKNLDLNAAVRATDYSTSGRVTTWKAGLTYSPIDDLTFRATRSRDIRAPSLNELFAAGVAGTSTLVDPFRNNVSGVVITVTSGNLGLKPEEADTTGVGLVVQPRFLPGFTASVDYYDIDIKGAIGAFAADVIVNGCFAGNTSFCGAIVRNASGAITQVNAAPFNANTLNARGVDFEASYRKSVDTIVSDWTGNLTVRLFATHYLKNFTDFFNPLAFDTDTAGENTVSGPPDWRYLASVSYDNGPATVTLTGRGISSGVFNNSFIECSTNCPPSTAARNTTDNNQIAGAFYLDAALSYQLRESTSVFLTVANVMDKDPAGVAAVQNIGNAPQGINRALYDAVGRTFRVGVRFRM